MSMAQEAHSFTLKITGADELLGGLALALKRVKAPFKRGVDNRVRGVIMAKIANNFKHERVLGQPWARLSPAYRAWKGVHAPGRPILVLRGRMRASLTQPAHPENRMIVQGRRLTLRFSNRLIKYHQHGTRKMPARPVFKSNRATAKLVATQVLEGITGLNITSVTKLFND
jgi:hypothetical protein